MLPHVQESSIVVTAQRGPLTESVHRGHIAAVNLRRETVAFAGNPDYVTFARSAAKPLQAIPLVESGGVSRYHLTDKQIALLCSSHNGEDEHAAEAGAILQALGLDETALTCGVHDPYHQPTADRLRAQGSSPTPLRNNCSGKHSGMLALARLLDVPAGRYAEPSHPVQQRMLQVISEFAGLSAGEITLGTDGCGVPVFALPLRALAYAYARLGNPEDLPQPRAEACRQIVESIRKEPFYVAGTGRFDTRLIEVTQGRILGKMGAEGVFALTIPAQGLGIAVKIEDGAMRALYPAVTETLAQLGLLNASEAEALSEFHKPFIVNCQQAVVGQLLPVLRLRRTE